MDMTYATIPVFGEQRILYRESRMAYMVRSKDKPQNFPIYDVETELVSAILFNELTDEAESEGKAEIQQIENQQVENQEIVEEKGEAWWLLQFDGSSRREGAAAGIWITTCDDESKFYSFKLNFDCTNNMAEYESLFLGLEILKRLGAKKILVCGYS